MAAATIDFKALMVEERKRFMEEKEKRRGSRAEVYAGKFRGGARRGRNGGRGNG